MLYIIGVSYSALRRTFLVEILYDEENEPSLEDRRIKIYVCLVRNLLLISKSDNFKNQKLISLIKPNS